MKYYLKLILVNSLLLSVALSESKFKTIYTLVKVWWFLLSRKMMLRGKRMEFSFFYNNKNFFLQLESAIDIAVLIEIFVLKEYDWSIEREVRSILDLGAHWGDSSLYYALTYPEAKIYAVEPTPNNFMRLQKLTDQFPNIVPIQAALGSNIGSMNLFVSPSSLGNSFERRSESDEVIQVQTHSLGGLCQLAGEEKFDIIKFDIEGAEAILFADTNNKNLGNFFIGEVHYDLISMSNEQVKIFFKGWQYEEIVISKDRSIIKSYNV